MEVVRNDEERKEIIDKAIKEYEEGRLTIKDACEKIKKEGKISISKSTFYQLRKKIQQSTEKNFNY